MEERRLPNSSSFYRKIMPGVVHEHRLVLPKNFVEEHGDELSSKIELDLPSPSADCSKWYIGLKESSSDLVYLHVGWEKFMNHYSIHFGWILLFKYKGNSVFDVHIFDPTTTEIQYPPPPVGGCNNGDAVCKEEIADGDGDAAAAAREMYKTVNPPSFNVKMLDRNVRKRYTMNLPREFTRKYMNGCPEFIKIVDSDEKIWRIRFIKYGDLRSLGKGWYNFVKEKRLKIGDVCVFKLVKKNAILKVDVFYAKRREGRTTK